MGLGYSQKKGNRMSKKLILLSAAFVSVATFAQGGPADRMMQPSTRAEVEARVKEQFAKLDADRDGSVTSAEMTARRGERREQMQERHFDRMDSNKDGSISRSEFDAAHAKRMERGGKRMGRGGGKPAGMQGAMMMRADRNGDGKITLDEMRTASLARFDRMDANKDGTVTPEERQAAQGARLGQRGAEGL
jgi:Ca2+-binding EF-hand superfamily protein